jgi:hypothetical protein
MKEVTITLTKDECELLFKLIGFEVSEISHILNQANKDGLPAPDAYIEERKVAEGIGDKIIQAVYGR